MDALYELLRAALPFEWARYDFMLNGLVIMLCLAPLSAAMGVHVVNFRMAFFSDAISHSAFTGVVLGYLLVPVAEANWPARPGYWAAVLPPLSLVVFGMIVGAGITAVRRRTELSADTIIGVFFAVVIAAGIAMLYRFRLQSDFQSYLYGSVLSVTRADVAVSLVVALGVGLFLFFSFNPLTLIGLNESLALSRGIRAGAWTHAYALLLALVVTLNIRTVGLLLVTAMLVVPAATARNLARGAGGMVWWSVLVGVLSGVGGLMLAYRFDTSVGAAVILLAGLLFTISLWAGPALKARSAVRPADEQ